MTKHCSVCKQPIHNTPYHYNFGNRDRCQKHCNCPNCAPAEHEAEQRADNEGLSPILPILAAELAADIFSSAPQDTPVVDTPASDPTPSATDFGGFSGGDSGGGGASGDF